MACKKKRHRYRPTSEPFIETQRTKSLTKAEPCDPISLERGVRQLLSNKVNGNMMGLWLLLPEHLRLGTWDLLCGWTGHDGTHVEPRLALQLVHEAALCSAGLRANRTLSQNGFELAQGLAFVATDQAIHQLLDEHSVADAQALQIALGQIRRASGHFNGKLLAIDLHRMRSYSKRQMRRHRNNERVQPTKVAQTFFALDADTHQPVCFLNTTSARTVAQATPELLELTAQILNPKPGQTLVLADAEHFTAELLDQVHANTHFDLLVPMPNYRSVQKQIQDVPPEKFTPQWAGYATMRLPYELTNSQTDPFYQYVQRHGEREQDWTFNAFLSTTERNEVDTLTTDYPKRWHIEEFFKTHQALGFKRAGTMNLNIRYGGADDDGTDRSSELPSTPSTMGRPLC